MKLALVGVGDAGGRIVNRILAHEAETGRDFTHGNTLVVNTAPTDFETGQHVPEDRQLLIGDTTRKVNGGGVDGDLDLGVTVAKRDLNEIQRAFDDLEMYDMDAVLLVAGLGGGTGAGAGAVVLEALTAVFEKPVYALGVLPADDEGPEPALNAARSLKTVVPTADNVVLFDNEVWHSTEDDEEGYERTNRELAKRVVTVFAGGEFDLATVAENKLDPSDIMRTLDTGGVSTIGYAATEVSTGGGGLLSWFWSDGETEADPTDAARIKRLVHGAVSSRLTLPCDVSSTERALIVLSGPPETFSRKGFEEARYWLEREADTVEILAGDEPREGASTLTAVVLLSNVTDVPRIDAIQERAVASRERLVK